ncbi:MAG: type III-A CRISPR-associated protein Cas10/Csm1, partial [Desulfomonilaceae bacterium]
MNDTTLKVAIGGFDHDIGKPAGKEDLGLDDDYIIRNQDIYQPNFDGCFSHAHGLYTAAFIEKFADVLPRQFNEPGWGEGDSLINLAACHHKPETPMQWIVTVADRLSAGWDRANFDNTQDKKIDFRDYQKTRLFTLFEKLDPDRQPDGLVSKPQHAYELKPISPISIFPKKLKEIGSISVDQARKEYSDLFQQFCSQLGNLAHRKENLELWFEHFDSLSLIYFSSVPSARAGEVVPDVSLYDHCRTVAALSGALYLYH